jgi:catechol 2,3-dioxygenase-like lactoylglutathione lyase family enzyme
VNLNQVTLAATDLAESIGFYRRLGLTQIVDAPHYARFECPGGATFSLHAAEAPVAVGDALIYFEYDSADALDTAIEALRTQDVVIDDGPSDQRWRWREARLRDPSGHRLCLYHAGDDRRFPPWRLPLASADTG